MAHHQERQQLQQQEHLDLSEYNGGPLIATAILFLTLSWISVGLRSYTRLVITKHFQVDDWLMLIGQIIFTLLCAFVFQGTRDGLGRHNAAVHPESKVVAGIMWQALAVAVYILDMMFVKLSIGVFLLRLASQQKVYTWILRVSLVVIAVWSVVIFFFDLFQCSPVEKQWDWRMTEGKCVSGESLVAAAYSISVMTVVSDWLYTKALLPIPMLWNVKMTKQAKTTVIAILGIGIFASVATLVRLRFLGALEITEDILFLGTDAMIWTLIEPGLAIVASSLATIRPLLRVLKIRGFESTRRTYGSTDQSRSRSRSGTGAMRSSSKRARNDTLSSSEPGQSSNDVALTEVDPGLGNRTNVTAKHLSITFDGQQDYCRQNNSPPGRQQQQQQQQGQHLRKVSDMRSDEKSEVYIIEGHERSPSRSFEDMGALEAQNQEGGLMPLGRRDR